MIGSECESKMYVRNMGYTLPLQIGGQKPRFSMTLQLNGKFNGLTFEMKHDVHNRASGVSYIAKNREL